MNYKFPVMVLTLVLFTALVAATTFPLTAKAVLCFVFGVVCRQVYENWAS